MDGSIQALLIPRAMRLMGSAWRREPFWIRAFWVVMYCVNSGP